MNKKIYIILLIFLVNLTGCRRADDSTIVRKDLFENIKGFIEFSEERAKEIDNGRGDTNIYWVQFFTNNGDDLVVIMQQPYYDAIETDGFLKIKENTVFFYYSDSSMVETNKLNHELQPTIPNENSKESGLGFSAPNWAYIITESGLEKIFIGE